MRRLTALSFSPWSEKAKWALDHHGIRYTYEEYPPVVGELKLRLRMRKPTGKVTVPVLYDDGSWITDSFDIAKEADRIGSAARLFPEGKAAEIEMWNRRSEAALSAGRGLAILEIARDPDAFLPLVPPLLRPILRPVGPRLIETFISKYRMRDGADQHERVVGEALAELDAALAEKGKYLVGDGFSYADIAMAASLQFLSPVDKRYMASPPTALRPSNIVALAARHPSLIAWRDELYAKHRPVVARQS